MYGIKMKSNIRINKKSKDHMFRKYFITISKYIPGKVFKKKQLKNF